LWASTTGLTALREDEVQPPKIAPTQSWVSSFSVFSAKVGQSVAPSSWTYWIFFPRMPPSALISSAAMCSTLETVFSEIAMPPVRELRKPSLMVLPEVSTQLGAADLPLDVSSPARAPQPASTRATVVAKTPVATSVRSRLLVVDMWELRSW
jgi:hypothetical protein